MELDAHVLCRWWALDRPQPRDVAQLPLHAAPPGRAPRRRGPPLDATRADLEAFLADRLNEVSAATVSSTSERSASFYAWLIDDEEITVNPAAKLRGPKVAETPVGCATEDDYRNCSPPARVRADRTAGRGDHLAVVVHGDAPRRSWPCSISLISTSRPGLLTIPKTKNGTPRRCPLPPTIGLLDRWLRRPGYEPGPLFPNEHGRRLTSNGVGQMLPRRCEEAGVRVTAHTFRRALATRWLRGGGGRPCGRRPDGAHRRWSLGTHGCTPRRSHTRSTDACSDDPEGSDQFYGMKSSERLRSATAGHADA